MAANSAQTGRDYLLPGEAKGGFISRPSTIESSQSKQKTASTITYKAFDGSKHQLVENRGRYVNVLLPQHYNDGAFFTADHIGEMVDRLDMLYALYTELMQQEPHGSGLLNIAFLSQTCGMGCGLVGAKGFEILSDPVNYEAIIRELDAGRLEPVLLHEMAHNFDTLSSHLHYLPDHAHAWTDIFEFFAPFRYSRASSHGAAPDDLYNSPVSSVWKQYVTDENADWQNCVIKDACGELGLSANNLWAMLYYRVDAMHGIEAILKSFDFLRDYAKTFPPPATELEREGVRILSLAAGANANIACYMDELKWPILAAVRSELETLFGASNAFCSDLDGDGFSAVNGDCDDTDASKNILMNEIGGDGADNDCDALIDEKKLVEAESGAADDNFRGPVAASLPFEVEGSSTSADDRDSFTFSLPATRRVRVTLCAHGNFKGWVAALQPDGGFLQADNWYSYQPSPGCTSNTFDFTEFSNAGLSVIADESTGDYSLTVTEAADLLPDHSSFVQVSPSLSVGMELQISDHNDLFANLGAEEIEIWISGVGKQIFVPFANSQTVQLNPSTAPELKDGAVYQVRARPRANGAPLAAFSAGHVFRYDLNPAKLPLIDDRFSGAWFDSEHDGEGFIVEVLENNRAVVFWFTYQPDGSQRWMVGVGSVEANRITVAELMDARGGRFGDDFNPDDVVLNTVGSLSLSFLDCSTALVNYSVDNNGDHQQTSRLTHVYGHKCNDSSPAPEIDISGSWFDPSHDGEGFIIEQVSADTAVVFWFTYDETGKQSWMFNTGTINDGSIQVDQLMQPMGGQFGRSFKPESVTQHEWGSLNLQLNCSGGTANYSALAEGYSSGTQSLLPLTRLGNSGCLD